MSELFLEALLDTVKLLPFLLACYLLIEYLEHKASERVHQALIKGGKFNVLIGSLLGCLPQCGFSVAASSLYARRVITMGTLLAVYIATSDEAILLFAADATYRSTLFPLLAAKIVIAVITGYLIDILFSSKQNATKETAVWHADHCHDGIILGALKHTAEIACFILITNFLLNILFAYTSESFIHTILLTDNLFQPFLIGLVGLFPNCGASIVIAELYLANAISFASLLSGLISGAGVGLAVLFQTNKNPRENLRIVGILYVVAVLSGVLLSLF